MEFLILVYHLAALLLAQLLARTEALVAGPCDDIFITNEVDDNSFEGFIKPQLDYESTGMWIYVQLNSKVNLLTSSLGYISTNDNRNYLIENDEVFVEKDHNYTVHFRMTYNAALPRPKVDRIYVNGLLQCPRNKNRLLIKKWLLKKTPVEYTTIPFIDIDDED